MNDEMDKLGVNRFNLGDTVYWFDNSLKNNGIKISSGKITKMEQICYWFTVHGVKFTIDYSTIVTQCDCFVSKEDACNSMIERLQNMMVQS